MNYKQLLVIPNSFEKLSIHLFFNVSSLIKCRYSMDFPVLSQIIALSCCCTKKLAACAYFARVGYRVLDRSTLVDGAGYFFVGIGFTPLCIGVCGRDFVASGLRFLLTLGADGVRFCVLVCIVVNGSKTLRNFSNASNAAEVSVCLCARTCLISSKLRNKYSESDKNGTLQ